MHLQILVELTKIISEQNKNPVRIEKNLVQKNPDKDKTRFYTVQFGSTDSTYLTITKPKNSEWSEAQQQKFSDQLYQMEQTNKLFYHICEIEEFDIFGQQVERQLEHSNSTQADQTMEGSESPSVRNLLKILSKPSSHVVMHVML